MMLVAVYVNGLKILRDTPGLDLLGPSSRSDFDDYFQAAKMLSSHQDPYRTEQYHELYQKLKDKEISPSGLDEKTTKLLLEKGRGYGSYLYPPFLAVVLQPLTPFAYPTAALIFQSLSWLALLIFLFHLHHYSRLNIPRPEIWWLLMVSVLSVYLFIEGNSTNGNIGFFLILLCGSGYLFSNHQRSFVEFIGGVLIGLAAMLKITPLFWGAPLLVARRYYAIFGVATGLFIAFLVSATFLGWERNLELSQNWYQLVIENFNRVAIIRPWANNQTISAAVGKLLMPFADQSQPLFGLPFIYSERLPTRSEMAVITTIPRWINFVLYVLLALLTLAQFFIKPSGSSKRPDLMEDSQPVTWLWVAILVSLVASGVSWYHSYAIMFLPLYLRLYQSYRSGLRLPAAERYYLSAVFFFGAFFGLMPSLLKKFFSIFSLFTWVSVAMVLYFFYQAAVQIYRGVFRSR